MMSTPNKKTILIVILTWLVVNSSFAQENNKLLAGIGGGLDYGGLGARITFLPVKQVGVFGSLGYNLSGMGYNVGLQYRIPSEKRLRGFATAMYGYNVVLKVEGPEGNSQNTYYGLSVGSGLEWKGRNEKGMWCLEVILPFRDKSFNNAVDDLRLAGYTVKEPLAVGFSVGYHFKLSW